MSNPTPSFSVNVDVTNPGQFFACCGLLELAHRLWPGAEGCFEEGRFVVSAPGRASSALVELLEAAIRCDVRRVHSRATDDKTAPLELRAPISMRLDWWLGDDGRPSLFKTWAANATSEQMFCKWREPLQKNLDVFAKQPERLLTTAYNQQGSYGFDSDMGWDALSVGFSLNEHAGLRELPTRPAVELLGAIGLQRFFPVLDREKQIVEYATWGTPLSAPVARVVVLGRVSVVTKQRLRTRFVYRGSFKGLDRAVIIQGEADE